MGRQVEERPKVVFYIDGDEVFVYHPTPAGWDHSRAVFDADKQWRIANEPAEAKSRVVDCFVDYVRDGQLDAYYEPTDQGWKYAKAALKRNTEFAASNPDEVKAAADWRAEQQADV